MQHAIPIDRLTADTGIGAKCRVILANPVG